MGRRANLAPALYAPRMNRVRAYRAHNDLTGARGSSQYMVSTAQIPERVVIVKDSTRRGGLNNDLCG